MVRVLHPFFGFLYHQDREQIMDREEAAEVEALDVENLEYDVGGAGAVESSDTMVNHGANIVVHFYR